MFSSGMLSGVEWINEFFFGISVLLKGCYFKYMLMQRRIIPSEFICTRILCYLGCPLRQYIFIKDTVYQLFTQSISFLKFCIPNHLKKKNIRFMFTLICFLYFFRASHCLNQTTNLTQHKVYLWEGHQQVSGWCKG